MGIFLGYRGEKLASGDSSRATKQSIIDRLTEHNVKLLKGNADLLISVSTLTKKIDELVEIFKKAAAHIEKGEIKEPLAQKLTDLLEQNKRIAKGLLLLEKFVQEKEGFPGVSKKKSDYGNLF